MRTTLVISDPVYERARKAAREKGIRLSALITEATEDFLQRSLMATNGGRRSLVRLKPLSMGVPHVNVDNREELYRKMEEG